MSKKYEFIDKAFEEFYNSEVIKLNRIYDDISGDFLERERRTLIDLALYAESNLCELLVPAFEKEGVEYANSKWQQISEKLPTMSYMYSREETVKTNADSGSSSWDIKSIAPMAAGGAAGAAVIGGCIVADVAKPVLLAGGLVGVLLFAGGVCIGYYIHNSKNKSTAANAFEKIIIFAKDENLRRLGEFIDKAKEITYICMKEE